MLSDMVRALAPATTFIPSQVLRAGSASGREKLSKYPRVKEPEPGPYSTGEDRGSPHLLSRFESDDFPQSDERTGF